MVSRLLVAVSLAAGLGACLPTEAQLPQTPPGPERCDNRADDDADGKADCLDPDCFGDPRCAHESAGGGAESNSDGGAGGGNAGGGNAGGGSAGSGGGASDAGGGADGDGGADCQGQACTALLDGAPCRSDDQCAGGKCLSEITTGAPGGACSNAAPCTPETGAGCHGGRCAPPSLGAPARCLASCTETGLGPTGTCRAGYACSDVDSDADNDTNVCVVSCTADAECAETGAGYGCNPWSKTCTQKDRGRLRYGAACTKDDDCETSLCFTGDDWPKGYCAGPCRGDLAQCAANGTCFYLAKWKDNAGTCYQACTADGECRADDNYACWDVGELGAPREVCSCQSKGSVCISDAHCCSGSCSVPYCD
jgi:hypothetical protein